MYMYLGCSHNRRSIRVAVTRPYKSPQHTHIYNCFQSVRKPEMESVISKQYLLVFQKEFLGPTGRLRDPEPYCALHFQTSPFSIRVGVMHFSGIPVLFLFSSSFWYHRSFMYHCQTKERKWCCYHWPVFIRTLNILVDFNVPVTITNVFACLGIAVSLTRVYMYSMVYRFYRHPSLFQNGT